MLLKSEMRPAEGQRLILFRDIGDVNTFIEASELIKATHTDAFEARDAAGGRAEINSI